MSAHPKAIVLSTNDNVATTIADLEVGAVITVDVHGRSEAITLVSHVPMGHKFALVDLKRGQAVIKYGEPIGQTMASVLRGEHVHVHNVMSRPRDGL